MNVYVVIEKHAFESQVAAVFLHKEDAESFIDSFDSDPDDETYEIHEEEVIE